MELKLEKIIPLLHYKPVFELFGEYSSDGGENLCKWPKRTVETKKEEKIFRSSTKRNNNLIQIFTIFCLKGSFQ